MKRALVILACICALIGGVYVAGSKWLIRHQTLDLFDAARQRPVSVDLAVRRDDEMWANDSDRKLPVAIISNGNTVKNTEYSFLQNVLAARGYLVASIQQDLPSDPPLMTIAGQPYGGRLAVYKRGEANILFVLGELKKMQPNADYDHLTLVGHSNGGDIAMFCAKEHPELVSKGIPLDRPELHDRPRRAADAGTGEGRGHRHRQDAVPAHMDERSRPGRSARRDSGDARQILGGVHQQRSVAGRDRQSADRQDRTGSLSVNEPHAAPL